MIVEWCALSTLICHLLRAASGAPQMFVSLMCWLVNKFLISIDEDQMNAHRGKHHLKRLS